MNPITRADKPPVNSNKEEIEGDQVIPKNLLEDRFKRKMIHFPKGSLVFRHKEFVAVLNSFEMEFSLFSLVSRRFFWKMGLPDNFEFERFGNCRLSDSGMSIMDSSSGDKMIVHEGKKTGMLTKRNWHSLIPIGDQIVGSYMERSQENTFYYYGEWDKTGQHLTHYALDHSMERFYFPHSHASNEKFWVRIFTGGKNFSPMIEIVNRVAKTFKTVTLPKSEDKQAIPSACIVGNHLIFGKNSIRPWGEHHIEVHYDPHICCFDLENEKMIGTYPTGANKGMPKFLVSTGIYAAWLEYRGSESDSVKCLDMTTGTIIIATQVPYCVDDPHVDLNIQGTILTVCYAEGYINGPKECVLWKREVIDLTTGELKKRVRYQRHAYGKCSLFNGLLAVTRANYDHSPCIYVEDFSEEPQEEETFRIQ